MKILLTGASGLVGSALARHASAAGHEIFGVVKSWSETVPGTAGLLARDLTAPAAADELVHGIRPTVIINAAAISEPSACEAAPEFSERLNVAFPTELAAAAARIGARFLHLSSEQVFDGESAPYQRDAPTHAATLYGRQKVASERHVLEWHPHAAVVRLPLLLGTSLTARRSVHERLFQLWASGQRAKLYPDEFRQVCSADSVATALLALAKQRELSGVFHWAGAETISRWELGRKIVARFGVSEIWIEEAPRPPGRARNLSLDSSPLPATLGVPLEHVEDAVAALSVPKWLDAAALSALR